MTMTKVRSQYRIRTLRNLVKSIIRNCCESKKYQATSYPDPKPGPLTKDRTEQCFPFQVIGVDYACPIFSSKIRKDLKAYILLFSWSVSRDVSFELVPNLTASKFIRCLRRLIARRSRPKIKNNAKKFKVGTRLLQQTNNPFTPRGYWCPISLNTCNS